MRTLVCLALGLLVTSPVEASVITIDTTGYASDQIGVFGEGVPSPVVSTFGQTVTAPITGYLTGFSFWLKSYRSSSDLPYNPTPLIAYVAQWQGPNAPALRQCSNNPSIFSLHDNGAANVRFGSGAALPPQSAQ
jgi:hypothetical protein